MPTINPSGQTITQYNVQTGGANNLLNNVAPSAATNLPLISNGVAAQPSFGVASVAGGGTGANTLTGILTGNGTSAITGSAVSQYTTLVAGSSNLVVGVGPGSVGEILTSNGAGASPSFQTNTAGDVFGPGSSTDNALVRFDGVTGKLIQNGVTTEDDTGNISQSAAVSGASLSTIISNTSNTASATAFHQVQVAGSTASDAYYEANISGGQAWTWGLDNSDSDAFVVSATATPGTTNVMRVSTAGEINYPLQPAFLGVLGTNDTNATGNGANYTLGSGNALTEIFDQGGDFTTAGVFTAPVTGRYQLSYNLSYSLLTALMTYVSSNIFTSNRVYSSGFINIGLVRTIAAAPNLGYSHSSALADMDAGDTFTVVAAIHGGAGNTASIDTTGARVFMSGFLAC